MILEEYPYIDFIATGLFGSNEFRYLLMFYIKLEHEKNWRYRCTNCIHLHLKVFVFLSRPDKEVNLYDACFRQVFYSYALFLLYLLCFDVKHFTTFYHVDMKKHLNDN